NSLIQVGGDAQATGECGIRAPDDEVAPWWDQQAHDPGLLREHSHQADCRHRGVVPVEGHLQGISDGDRAWAQGPRDTQSLCVLDQLFGSRCNGVYWSGHEVYPLRNEWVMLPPSVSCIVQAVSSHRLPCHK